MVKPVLPCKDCGVNLYQIHEYAYMLKKWTFGRGYLCIGCVESRLGRRLEPKDFNWNLPITYTKCFLRSERLLERQNGTL